MGIAFPLFYLLNISFIVWWLFRRKRLYAALSFIAVVLCWGIAQRHMQFKRPQKQENCAVESGVKILSYNVHIFKTMPEADYRNSYDTVLGFLNNESADIICLQEFKTYKRWENGNEEAVLKGLSNTSNAHIEYGRTSTVAKYGLATFSSFPIVGKGSIPFEESINASIYTDIAINTDTVRVYNLHLQSIRLKKNNYEFMDSIFYINSERMLQLRDMSSRMRYAYKIRAKQVDKVAEHIKQSPYKVIVCGDFNDTPVSYAYQRLRNGLKDSFIEAGSGIGTTYNGEFPAVRIDYIFTDKSIEAKWLKTLNYKISDHYPLVGCFEF